MVLRSVSLLLTLLVLSHSSTLSQEKRSSTQDNAPVMMTVTVSDKSGHFVDGLNRDAFVISDEKVLRPVAFFEDADTPVGVGILIDTSGSMPWSTRSTTNSEKMMSEFLKPLFELGHPKNEYFVMAFDETPRLFSDWSTGEKLSLKGIDTEGVHHTGLYDACVFGLEKLRTAKFARTVLIVISDGEDNFSKSRFTDLENLLRASDVIFYGVAILEEGLNSVIFPLAGRSTLRALTETTGGKSFDADDKKQLIVAMSALADELRHQYRLGFRRDELPQLNSWRRLKITVNASPDGRHKSGKLSVRTRQGYIH